MLHQFPVAANTARQNGLLERHGLQRLQRRNQFGQSNAQPRTYDDVHNRVIPPYVVVRNAIDGTNISRSTVFADRITYRPFVFTAPDDQYLEAVATRV